MTKLREHRVLDRVLLMWDYSFKGDNMTSKKLERILKKIGKETELNMDSMVSPELEEVIIEASKAMQQVQEELEANPKYEELKESLSALQASKKEVDSRQKAVIAFALHRLTEIGNM